MGDPMKHLYLLRHGKSDWTDHETIEDFARPLAKRGKKASAKIGLHLNGGGFKPVDLVLCSGSVRTRETWDRVAAELTGDDQIKVKYSDKLYHAANTISVVKMIRKMKKDHQAIMVVGHFPWIMLLANDLLMKPKISEFPTCALVYIQCDIKRWKDLLAGSPNNNLEHFVRPRSL